MKQIFDWLKEEIEANSVTVGGADIIGSHMARVLVNQAEAKWEKKHKPYDVEKVVEQIHDYFCKVIDTCEEDIIPHEILEYNKAVCEIILREGRCKE